MGCKIFNIFFSCIADIELLIGIFFSFFKSVNQNIIKTAKSRKSSILICSEIFTVKESRLKEINELVSKLQLFKMEIQVEKNNLCCTFFKLCPTTFANKFKHSGNSSIRYNVSYLKFFCRCTWDHSKDKPQAK